MALVTNYVAEMTRFFFEGTGERIAIRDRSPLIKADLSSRRTRNKKKKKRKKKGRGKRKREKKRGLVLLPSNFWPGNGTREFVAPGSRISIASST